MRIPRVYEPQPLMVGAEVELGEVASQHLGRVLRMKAGDELILFNGEGEEFSASITVVSKKAVRVLLAQSISPVTESPLKVFLGQCLSKGDRMDYAVQKATELGVSHITPLFSARSEVKLAKERAEKRQRHWQQIAVSACEQSYRTKVPELAMPSSLSDWLQQVEADLKLVLDPRGAEPLDSQPKPLSVAMLIGPEGGLSDAEVAMATAAGFQPIVLGPRILRTETAPVAALTLLQYVWGDFG